MTRKRRKKRNVESRPRRKNGKVSGEDGGAFDERASQIDLQSRTSRHRLTIEWWSTSYYALIWYGSYYFATRQVAALDF